MEQSSHIGAPEQPHLRGHWSHISGTNNPRHWVHISENEHPLGLGVTGATSLEQSIHVWGSLEPHHWNKQSTSGGHWSHISEKEHPLGLGVTGATSLEQSSHVWGHWSHIIGTNNPRLGVTAATSVKKSIHISEEQQSQLETTVTRHHLLRVKSISDDQNQWYIMVRQYPHLR